MARADDEFRDDLFDLNRFVAAQEPVYDQVLSEIRNGRKPAHWIWFVFPQLDGLGSSATARYYAIKSLDEAQSYLNHPVLGAVCVNASRPCWQSTAVRPRRSSAIPTT